MRSASVRASVVLSAALLALVLFGTNGLAQSVSVGVDTQFSPNPGPVCGNEQATVSATISGLPTVPYGCDLGMLTWAWSVDGPPGVTIDGSISGGNGNDIANGTVTANICTPGTYTITVAGTATWQDSCGNIYTASASVTLAPLTVVAVTSITPLSEVQNKNIGDTLTKSDFTITTNPPGYDYLVTVPNVTIQIGDNNVTATCGCSSASTDIIGCICSGSLSDLIVGGTGYDDSMSFSALVQGCGGNYAITGSDSAVVIDGGDTSGSLDANETHYGTFYVSSTPPSDFGTSRFSIFLNGSLAYGLGGITGCMGHTVVNGQSSGSGVANLTVKAVAGIGLLVGVYSFSDSVTLKWILPLTSPPNGGGNLNVNTTNDKWTPTTVSCSYKVTPTGHARVSMYGFKYTENPTAYLLVNVPNPRSVTDPNGKNVSAWTYAQVAMAGQKGDQETTEQSSSAALDGATGETQIETATGLAKLWVGTADQNDPDWPLCENNVSVLYYHN